MSKEKMHKYIHQLLERNIIYKLNKSNRMIHHDNTYIEEESIKQECKICKEEIQ